MSTWQAFLNWTRKETGKAPRFNSLGLLSSQISYDRISLFQNTWNHASWNIPEIHTSSDHSWTAGNTIHHLLNKNIWIQLLNWWAQAQELLTGSTFTEYLVMLGSTLFPWLAACGSTEKVIIRPKETKTYSTQFMVAKENYHHLDNQLTQNTWECNNILVLYTAEQVIFRLQIPFKINKQTVNVGEIGVLLKVKTLYPWIRF